MKVVLGRSADTASRPGLASNSVRINEARVSRQSLWLVAEVFAVLVDSEDVDVIEFVSKTSAVDL